MHNENCYTNGSYFFDVNVNEDSNSIMCVLPGFYSKYSGEWFAPLCCNVVSSPANISLYKKLLMMLYTDNK